MELVDLTFAFREVGPPVTRLNKPKQQLENDEFGSGCWLLDSEVLRKSLSSQRFHDEDQISRLDLLLINCLLEEAGSEIYSCHGDKGIDNCPLPTMAKLLLNYIGHMRRKLYNENKLN